MESYLHLGQPESLFSLNCPCKPRKMSNLHHTHGQCIVLRKKTHFPPSAAGVYKPTLLIIYLISHTHRHNRKMNQFVERERRRVGVILRRRTSVRGIPHLERRSNRKTNASGETERNGGGGRCMMWCALPSSICGSGRFSERFSCNLIFAVFHSGGDTGQMRGGDRRTGCFVSVIYEWILGW